MVSGRQNCTQARADRVRVRVRARVRVGVGVVVGVTLRVTSSPRLRNPT